MIRPDTPGQLELAPCLERRSGGERIRDRERPAFQAVNPFHSTAVLFLTSLGAVPKIKHYEEVGERLHMQQTPPPLKTHA